MHCGYGGVQNTHADREGRRQSSENSRYLDFSEVDLWSPYVIGQTIYIFILSFVLLLLSFFPRLISAVGDWMSAILPHMVWP